MGKLCLVLLASLLLNDYWQYCASSKGSEAVSSCTSSDMLACESFCGDTANTLFTIPIRVLNTTSAANTVDTVDAGYCTATLTGSCSCTYWKIFVMGPMLLHVLHFVVQCGWYMLLSGFDPLQHRYEAMTRYWERESSWKELIASLQSKYPWSNALAVLELIMMTYVWMSLLFPPVRCDLFVPTSFLYYPLMLTLLDCCKLNAYRAMRWLGKVWRHRASLTFSQRVWESMQALVLFFSVDVLLWYLGILCVQSWLWINYLLPHSHWHKHRTDNLSSTAADTRPTTIEFRDSARSSTYTNKKVVSGVETENPIKSVQ